MFKRILPLQPLKFDTFPTVYDDNFTFLEELTILYKKLEEVIKYLDEFNIEEIEKYVDNSINQLKLYIDNQDNLIKNYCNDTINEKIAEVYNALENLKVELKNYTDGQVAGLIDLINALRSELETEIENIIVGNINVLNPTSR